MQQAQFKINIIKPWRMLLFGVAPMLVLIYAYLVVWELLPDGQTRNFLAEYGTVTIIVLIVAGAFLMFAGFKKSGYTATISITCDGITILNQPNLKLLPTKKITQSWENINTYDLVEDDKGNVLTIYLKNHKPITIGQSNMFETAENFAAFYNTFEFYIKQYNLNHAGANAAIKPAANFYGKAWAKALAVLLVIALVAFAFLGKFYGEPVPYFWVKYIAFLLPAGFFIYRALVARK